MAFQETGDGAVKAEQNINVEKSKSRVLVERRILFFYDKMFLYCFYPKKTIEVRLSIIMIS